MFAHAMPCDECSMEPLQESSRNVCVCMYVLFNIIDYLLDGFGRRDRSAARALFAEARDMLFDCERKRRESRLIAGLLCMRRARVTRREKPEEFCDRFETVDDASTNFEEKSFDKLFDLPFLLSAHKVFVLR